MANSEKRKTKLIGEYPINIPWYQLKCYLDMHQNHAPAYNLITHNCQVQSKQVIAAAFTSYRPPWWSFEQEQEFAQNYIVEGSLDYYSEYMTDLANVIAENSEE